MSLVAALRAMLGKKNARDSARELAHEESVRKAFQARCRHFRSLLSANKRALDAMTNLEDAMRGDRFFNMSFVRSQNTTLVTNVFHMTRHLNELSGNAHSQLHDRLRDIQQKIVEALEPRTSEAGPLVLPLGLAGFPRVYEVGSKMASLGEAAHHLHLPIPEGFVVTASGFRAFVTHNMLGDEIFRILQLTDITDLKSIYSSSKVLVALIEQAVLPPELVKAVTDQIKALGLPEDARFAVRSSAIGEDAHGSSFAGQFRSELNVPARAILDAYKRVVASKYCPPAMTYRYNRGIPDDEMPMSVGVLAMVDARAGGVAYSHDPMLAAHVSHDDRPVVINAVAGLPKTVVDGASAFDFFAVSREEPRQVLQKTVGNKQTKTVCDPESGLHTVPLSQEESLAPCISEAEATEVAAVTHNLETFYGLPQDVEWAYRQDGRFVLLQSRPLLDVDAPVPPAPYEGDATVLASGGICASPGVASGKVCRVRQTEDLLGFPDGGVLVVENAHSRWAPILSKVSAVVAGQGGKAGHLASVAREYGIPAIFGLQDVFSLLADGEQVSVDADNCRVLQGTVLAKTPKPRRLFLGSPIHKRLSRAMPHIVPLNLVDPDSPDFDPENCQTLHDITRFCHEKAVEEMFRLDASIFAERCGKQLKYKGSALQYFVVNINEGFCSAVEGRYVEFSQVCSKPMLALWEGMLAVPYTPRATTGRGFLAVVAESACNPELEVTSSSQRLSRNYFLIDKHYCNLQASFGYHFCTVECQAGEVPFENFVSFHFKGGAANLARRKLRVEALHEVLAEHGFIAELREDTLSAVAENMVSDEACKLLYILGHLVVHTRQADATLTDSRSARQFADSLRQGIAKTLEICAMPKK